MSKFEAMEAEIRSWPREQVEELRNRLSNYLEDHAEIRPEFIESIGRGNADIASDRVRVERV